MTQNLNQRTLYGYHLPEEAYYCIFEDDILFRGKENLDKLIEFLRENHHIKVTGARIVPYGEEFLGREYVHPLFYEAFRRGYVIIDKPSVPAQPHVHGGLILMQAKNHPGAIPRDMIFIDGWRSGLFSLSEDEPIGSQRHHDAAVFHNEATSLPVWRDRWKKMLDTSKDHPKPQPLAIAAARQREIAHQAVIEDLSEKREWDKLAEYILVKGAMQYNMPWENY